MEFYAVDREQRVDRPLEQVFTFFARPKSLALITPPSLDFHLLTPSPIVMEHGSIVGPLRWRSLIFTYRAPHSFAGERLLGPHSFWHRRVEDPRAVRGPIRLQLPRSLDRTPPWTRQPKHALRSSTFLVPARLEAR